MMLLPHLIYFGQVDNGPFNSHTENLNTDKEYFFTGYDFKIIAPPSFGGPRDVRQRDSGNRFIEMLRDSD